MSFKSWLLTQVEEDNPIGDFARDLKADKCCRAWTVAGIREHVTEKHGACDAALEALNQAEIAFTGRPTADVAQW